MRNQNVWVLTNNSCLCLLEFGGGVNDDRNKTVSLKSRERCVIYITILKFELRKCLVCLLSLLLTKAALI